MSNQKRFLTVMLVIFVVISSLTITGMAMLLDGMKKLVNLNLTDTADLLSLPSITANADYDELSSQSFSLLSSLSFDI